MFVHELTNSAAALARPLPSECVERWDLSNRPEIPRSFRRPRHADTPRAYLDRRGWAFHRYAFRHCRPAVCRARTPWPSPPG